jgi:hypothetical protein
MRRSTLLVLGLALASSALAQDSATPALSQPAAQATLSAGRHRAVQFPPAKPIVPKTVVLTPSKDNTLYQTPDGSVSNGTGSHIFAGTTSSFQFRRALIAFDIAAQIPAGSTITHVTLVLHESQTVAGPELIELHRVTADWGQGSSNAGTTRDGIGSQAQTGDATWIHTFFPDRRWTSAGGDFDAAADSVTAVNGFGVSTWDSSVKMIARVQDWLDHPSQNFGWIVIGDESNPRTAKRFDSREVDSPSTRPTLTIDFNTSQ